MRQKLNSIPTGLISGILLPWLCFILVVLIKKGTYSSGEYLHELGAHGAIPRILSICLIPNLLLFFLFLRNDLLRSARGVLFSMFITGIVILITKFT